MNILNNLSKYIVLSHQKLYHEQIIDPIMTAKGYEIIYERDLCGRIEPMWNVFDIKEGTNIKIWKKK